MINVLVVDDDEDDAALFQRQLEMKSRRRMMVTLAHNLVSGLKIAFSLKPAIILTDLKMPDANGLDAVRAFVAKLPNIPVICLTDNDSDSIGLEAVRAGAENSIVKSQIQGNFDILRREIIFAIERHRRHMSDGEGWRNAAMAADVLHDILNH